MIKVELRKTELGKVLVIVAKCSTEEEARSFSLDRKDYNDYELLPKVQESITDNLEFPYFRVAQWKPKIKKLKNEPDRKK